MTYDTNVGTQFIYLFKLWYNVPGYAKAWQLGPESAHTPWLLDQS